MSPVFKFASVLIVFVKGITALLLLSSLILDLLN